MFNVRQMFPLHPGICLITEETYGQTTHDNAILGYAAVLKRIFSRRCGVLIEGPLGDCVTQVLSFFSVLMRL